eukprot:363881-Chlamydomonas_euryale.AAC.6
MERLTGTRPAMRSISRCPDEVSLRPPFGIFSTRPTDSRFFRMWRMLPPAWRAGGVEWLGGKVAEEGGGCRGNGMGRATSQVARTGAHAHLSGKVLTRGSTLHSSIPTEASMHCQVCWRGVQAQTVFLLGGCPALRPGVHAGSHSLEARPWCSGLQPRVLMRPPNACLKCPMPIPGRMYRRRHKAAARVRRWVGHNVKKRGAIA